MLVARPAANIIVEPGADAAADRTVEHVVGVIAERIAEAGACHLALSGGTTPCEVYRRLAAPAVAEGIDWAKVRVFFGDERDVPQDHVENNYRMVAKTLLDHVPIPLPHVHPMPADGMDLAAAAKEYEDLIRRLVPAGDDDLPRFDLILLGLGADGHTASLFPGTHALPERRRLVAAQFVPVIGRNRMTFTFPLINAARRVTFLVTGADKAPVVASVLSSDAGAKVRLPAAQVAPANGELTFILDTDAARRIDADA